MIHVICGEQNLLSAQGKDTRGLLSSRRGLLSSRRGLLSSRRELKNMLREN